MKRLFGLKKKKIKIGGDEDEDGQQIDTTYNNNAPHAQIRSYSPPSVGNTGSNNNSAALDILASVYLMAAALSPSMLP